MGADEVKLPAPGSISMPVFALPLIVVPLMVSVLTSLRESGAAPVSQSPPTVTGLNVIAGLKA